MAAALSAKHEERTMYSRSYCYTIRQGVFAKAGVLSLACISLGIVYYVILSSAKNTEPGGVNQNQGIALAQPQIPPQNTQPVFVHEDTYNRQQFP